MAALDRGSLTEADLNIDMGSITGLTVVDQSDWLLGSGISVGYTAPASDVYEYLPRRDFGQTSTDIGSPPWYEQTATAEAAEQTSLWGDFSAWAGSDAGVGAAGLLTTAFSAIGNAFSGYYASETKKIQLQMQQQVAEFNQRQAERSAQAALMQSNARIGQISRKYESIKSSQKASMAANGVVLGVGSAAEVVTTTDIDREVSINNQYLNGYREAWGYRMQGVSQGLQASAAQAYRTSAWGSAIEGGTSAIAKYGRDYLYRRRNDNYGVI